MQTLDSTPTYSQIITPEDYIRTITKEHLYIADADKKLVFFIEQLASKSPKKLEVVELGCGPGRILPLLANAVNIRLTGIDHDMSFVEYAKKFTKGLDVTVVLDNVISYQHPRPVDIFCSMGAHHHIPKGEETVLYLKNVFKQLTPGGYYLLADEFLPHYRDTAEREVRLVIWYSHIIANALTQKYEYLATEEAKTLLDDIDMGHSSHTLKNQQQIDLVLLYANKIDTASLADQQDIAIHLAQELLQKLNTAHDNQPTDDKTILLSREDYKICEQALKDEVEPVGFVVEEVQSIGPIKNIGGMSVYILRKP